MPLTGAVTVVRSGTLLESEVDGEVVALSLEKGVCYGLNDVGSSLWRLVARPMRIDAACQALRAEFDVDMDTCRREVIELLEDLRREGLIEVLAE